MQVMHDDDNNITICTALYQSSCFFIIMSPAEGLHFSALVIVSTCSLCCSQWMHKLHRLRAGSLQEEGGVAGPPPHRQPPPVVRSTPCNQGRGDDSSPLGVVCTK